MSDSSSDLDGPSELSPRDAFERYVDRRRTEITAGSASTYYYRLKLWAEWCEQHGIEHVGELSGWTFEQYEATRAGEDVAVSTLHNEMETLKTHVEYLERIEAVEAGLAAKVNVPEVPEGEKSRDTKLTTDDALAQIQFYRSNENTFGTRHHVFLELAWHTGARLGALRGLDLRDYNRRERYVEFVHRPQTDTPLKNKRHGERMVKLLPEVCTAVDAYIWTHRWDKHDNFGRQPLLASLQGRPARNTVRVWSYEATFPCLRGPCPHGHEPASCEFKSHNHASKCPSSRAPHHIRTGSITWHRDRGYPKEATAERVNASQEVIDRFYDKATKYDEMELRRGPHLEKLKLD